MANQLRLPEGTVGSRLARARAMLAKRLARRGLHVSPTSLAALLASEEAARSVPPALLSSAIKAASLLASGEAAAAGAISTQVSALSKGVVKAMGARKLKAVGVMLLMAAPVLAGGMVAYHKVAGPAAGPEPSSGAHKAVADIRKFGTEDDAKAFARRLIDLHDAVQGGVPSNYISPMEAHLNETTGQWTVTWSETRAFALLLRSRQGLYRWYDLKAIFHVSPGGQGHEVSWDRHERRLQVEGALEGESLKVLGKSSDFPLGRQEAKMLQDDGRWSGDAQLWGRPPKAGEWADLEVTVPTDGKYTVVVHLTALSATLWSSCGPFDEAFGRRLDFRLGRRRA